LTWEERPRTLRSAPEPTHGNSRSAGNPPRGFIVRAVAQQVGSMIVILPVFLLVRVAIPQGDERTAPACDRRPVTDDLAS
jgi:hypothetical protein